MVCSHLGSGTATLRGPEHYKGSALAGSPAGSGWSPRVLALPYLPLGLFRMSLLLPRNSGMPNALQAELDPGPS